MTPMEFETELDVAGIDEINKSFLKKYMIMIHVLALFILVNAVLAFSRGDFSSGIFQLANVIVLEVVIFFSLKRSFKLSSSRALENCNGKALINRYEFGETVIHCHNLITDAKVDMPYTLFKKYFETEHYAVLITKSKQFLAFDKALAIQNDIKGFTKAKNPYLKAR